MSPLMLSRQTELKAVIFDWAGTLIDFGSFAPMGVFVEAFAEFAVEVSVGQARAPMGLPKRDHIAAMLSDPDVRQKWEKLHGPVDEFAIDRVYSVFLPLNEKVAADYATLVPGALETLNWLQQHDIAIATTTGYTRSIMDHVLPVVAKQGFNPPVVICSDELIEGRPGPLGIYKCMVELGVYPPASIIKVDDTQAGIMEGASAGCLTVGVSLSGNHAALSVEELAGLSPEHTAEIRNLATSKLKGAGADHVLDTLADLPDLINQLHRAATY